jgi:hypothetical protein
MGRADGLGVADGGVRQRSSRGKVGSFCCSVLPVPP